MAASWRAKPDQHTKFRRLARIDIATRRYTFLSSQIPWDIFEVQLSPNGKMIAVTANEDGKTTLHLLDAVSGREKPLPDFPPGYVIDLHWHRNSRDLGFSLDSARSPDDAYTLDTKTGKVERWTFSELGGLNTEGFIEPSVFHWKSFDDRRRTRPADTRISRRDCTSEFLGVNAILHRR
jgi:dipeptidyl aminopeptidase/acylaminoacyl peptidase